MLVKQTISVVGGRSTRGPAGVRCAGLAGEAARPRASFLHYRMYRGLRRPQPGTRCAPRSRPCFSWPASCSAAGGAAKRRGSMQPLFAPPLPPFTPPAPRRLPPTTIPGHSSPFRGSGWRCCHWGRSASPKTRAAPRRAGAQRLQPQQGKAAPGPCSCPRPHPAPGPLGPSKSRPPAAGTSGRLGAPRKPPDPQRCNTRSCTAAGAAPRSLHTS